MGDCEMSTIWSCTPRGLVRGKMGAVGRIDYNHVSGAPRANSLVVGGCAVVPDAAGRILLQRRADNRQWALPGGGMDRGETFGDSVVRERVRLGPGVRSVTTDLDRGGIST